MRVLSCVVIVALLSSLSALGLGGPESAFSLSENSSTDLVHVTVNSGREDFKLSDFKAWLPKPGLPVHHQNKENK